MSNIKAKVMTAMRTLPPLPIVVSKLLSVMNDEDSSADDVTRVLSSDQALAGKVLKLVNSPFYGLTGEISTITRAVVVLGFSGVRNVAMGFGMVSALKKLGGGRAMSDFWDHALATGAGAQALAEMTDCLRHDPEEAFIAGLMHDIGHLILASAAPGAYTQACEASGDADDPLLAEKVALGMSHAQVGQKLMEFWQLPAALQDAARYHHSLRITASREQPLTTLVALGDVLACIHGGAFERPASENAVSRLLRLWCLEPDQLRGALNRMHAKIDEMRIFLQIADEDGTIGQARSANDDAFPVVLVSTDPETQRWVGGLLEHFGHTQYPARDFFGREQSARHVKLVVLDPSGVTREQLARLLAFLRQQPIVTAALRTADVPTWPPELLADLPELPYVFSRADIQRLASLVTV